MAYCRWVGDSRYYIFYSFSFCWSMRKQEIAVWYDYSRVGMDRSEIFDARNQQHFTYKQVVKMIVDNDYCAVAGYDEEAESQCVRVRDALKQFADEVVEDYTPWIRGFWRNWRYGNGFW